MSFRCLSISINNQCYSGVCKVHVRHTAAPQAQLTPSPASTVQILDSPATLCPTLIYDYYCWQLWASAECVSSFSNELLVFDNYVRYDLSSLCTPTSPLPE